MCSLGWKNWGDRVRDKVTDLLLDKDKTDRENREIENSSSHPETGDVYLHLIVPASEVSDLKVNKEIDFSKIESLIDSCLYFSCSTQEQLSLEKDETLSLQGQREAYIKIFIPNGQAMLGKTTLYPLKRDFPPNEIGTVKELFMLKNFSGLEKFNHI